MHLFHWVRSIVRTLSEYIAYLYKVFQFVQAISVSSDIAYICSRFQQQTRYFLTYNFDIPKQDMSFLNFKVNFAVPHR